MSQLNSYETIHRSIQSLEYKTVDDSMTLSLKILTDHNERFIALCAKGFMPYTAATAGRYALVHCAKEYLTEEQVETLRDWDDKVDALYEAAYVLQEQQHVPRERVARLGRINNLLGVWVIAVALALPVANFFTSQSAEKTLTKETANATE